MSDQVRVRMVEARIIEGLSPEVTLTPKENGVEMSVTTKSGTKTALIPKGDTYELTSEDKEQIAEMAFSEFAETAHESVLEAEGHAVGKQDGTDVESGSPYYHNNAKYYAEQAAGSNTAAQAAKTAAQEAAATASAAYGTDLLAPDFSTSSTYAVGDYVIHSGDLYRCTTAVTTAGEWNNSSWTQVEVGGEVGALKSAISSGVLSVGDLLADMYITVGGNIQNYNGWSATNFIEIPTKGGLIIHSSANSGGSYNAFYDSNLAYITGSNFSFNSGTTEITVPDGAKYFRLSAVTSTMQTISYGWWIADQTEKNAQDIIEIINNKQTIPLGDLLADRYITSSGNVQNYNGWSATDFVDLPNRNTIKINASGGSGGDYNAFYNAQKEFIPNTAFPYNTGVTIIQIPENAKYARFSGTNAIMQTLEVYYEPFEYSEKLDDGFYSLNRFVEVNNWGYITIGDVGSVVDYTPVYDASKMFAIFEVKKGDVFKISGSGGITNRLWTFVDASDKVISKSAANLVVSDLLIMAPDDGKLIYCSYFATYDINKKAVNATQVYEETLKQREYDYQTKGLDILSAFTNVSCFGDSLTASVVYTRANGDGTHQTRSAYKKYPMILGQKIGATAESVATGGYSATDWWNAYSSRIVAKENQLVIVYLGTNGGLTDTLSTDAAGDDPTQYANTNTGNYCKIVAKALSVGARVLLIKIHQGGGDGHSYVTNDVIDKIGTKFGVAVVDVPFLKEQIYHEFPDGTGSNTLHYNDFGYAAFAERLIRTVGAQPYEVLVKLIPV